MWPQRAKSLLPPSRALWPPPETTLLSLKRTHWPWTHGWPTQTAGRTRVVGWMRTIGWANHHVACVRWTTISGRSTRSPIRPASARGHTHSRGTWTATTPPTAHGSTRSSVMPARLPRLARLPSAKPLLLANHGLCVANHQNHARPRPCGWLIHHNDLVACRRMARPSFPAASPGCLPLPPLTPLPLPLPLPLLRRCS